MDPQCLLDAIRICCTELGVDEGGTMAREEAYNLGPIMLGQDEIILSRYGLSYLYPGMFSNEYTDTFFEPRPTTCLLILAAWPKNPKEYAHWLVAYATNGTITLNKNNFEERPERNLTTYPAERVFEIGEKLQMSPYKYNITEMYEVYNPASSLVTKQTATLF